MKCEGCGQEFPQRVLCDLCLKTSTKQICAICGKRGRTLAIAYDGTRVWFCGEHKAHARWFDFKVVEAKL